MAKRYCEDQTSNADFQAELMRQWYEKHRESWWDRHGRFGSVRTTGLADNFMLALLKYADEVIRGYPS
jgi:tRNA/tmRNA/rRNA uracil-C5-methylase (TrmA/RlmC/RlmD family)